jgi:hypothetical protein
MLVGAPREELDNLRRLRTEEKEKTVISQVLGWNRNAVAAVQANGHLRFNLAIATTTTAGG